MFAFDNFKRRSKNTRAPKLDTQRKFILYISLRYKIFSFNLRIQ